MTSLPVLTFSILPQDMIFIPLYFRVSVLFRESSPLNCNDHHQTTYLLRDRSSHPALKTLERHMRRLEAASLLGLKLNPKYPNLCLETNNRFTSLWRLWKQITQTTWHKLWLITSFSEPRPVNRGWRGNLKNEEAQQYEGARQPLKLIASAFPFEDTWGIVFTRNLHLHPYQRYPVGLAITGCRRDFLTRSYNSPGSVNPSKARRDVHAGLLPLVGSIWGSYKENTYFRSHDNHSVTGSDGISHVSILELVFHIGATLLTPSARHESCCLKRTEDRGEEKTLSSKRVF